MKTGLRAFAVAMGAACVGPSAWCWDGAVVGRVANLHVTGLNNFAFRVSLQGNPVLCAAGHTWAYVSGTDANYKVYVATLLSAQARGAQVTVYTNHDGSGASYCQIGYLASE